MNVREPTIQFPVVGLGASAGGLEAFQQLLANLPVDTGMAFVLVQHLDPKQPSRLAPLLARSTTMPVQEVSRNLPVEPDTVYVISPNSDIGLRRGALQVTPRPPGRGVHHPVDHLFRSLANDQQSKAIGVVLSGTGSDGTQGLAEIKAVGGITFAEDEVTARHVGMPKSAIDSGYVDFVLTPELIAKRLAEIASHPYLAPAAIRVSDEKGSSEETYSDALAIVRSATGVDFSQYRDTTIKRRIMRRMALHTQHSLKAYTQHLQNDPREVDALYHDLLINVTSFFRDPEMFEALKAQVFPAIASGHSTQRPIRVWVPGCSTGQESYSLAVALIEFFDDEPDRPSFQIFATDLSDRMSLEKARAGVYPESIEAEVSPERLRRFFVKEDHVYRISKEIRDVCVFARQNVTADPPFSHVDLISCRNVLIYLSPSLQKRVLPTFHYSLNVPGFLVLGSAESVGDSAALFELVDRDNKIYAKKAAAHSASLFFAARDPRGRTGVEGMRPRAAQGDFQKVADKILLGRYSPPGVLLNEDLDVLQFRGRTSPYLEPPTGEPTTNILKLAKEGLFLELRSAVNEVKRGGRAVRREGVPIRSEGEIRKIALEVLPVSASRGDEGCFLVLFHEAAPGGASPPAEAPEPATAEVTESELTHLRQELAATKEYLQSVVEQQEAVNEDLQSANEEILSSNEELQSTNEELETAKEELQSTNEELTTVNEQLQQRNVELNTLYSDLNNLSTSTTIPIVMVGSDLRIRRFTNPARGGLGLTSGDVGRTITDVRLMIQVPDLADLIDGVMRDVQMREREIRGPDGRWQELRLYPYRTTDNRIDGVVLVLHDVDLRRRAEDDSRAADRRKDEFLATLAHELRNPLASIRNAVEILHRASGSDSAAAHAREVLDRQVHQLSRIVDDLIDVSRIIEKKIALARQLISISEIVEMAVESCRQLVGSMGHELSVSLPRETLYVDADPVRLVQVLVNLLNNAAKFTEPGGHISVRVKQASDERNPAGVAVMRIRDDGIGIAPELLPRIFDMFTQGEAGIARQRGGLGVGLALSRSLAEMHGGDVQAQSDGPGKGSEFIVRLPLSSARPARPNVGRAGTPDTKAPETTSNPRRILVVDDSADHAESLSVLLRMMGHEVELAADGPSALKSVVTFNPDLVLLDLGLPGMSGYEVARGIRQHRKKGDVMIVAQTGWGRDEDRRASQEAGFDDHIVKPVTPEAIEGLLTTLKNGK